jgi:DEAD/DEAH box helicase domain-containing protein
MNDNPKQAGQGVLPLTDTGSLARREYVVLDVETRHSAGDVGGWNRADLMGVSVAVLYDSRTDAFRAFGQDEIPELGGILQDAPLVVGFNIIRFDYAVLRPHAPGLNFRALPTLDMLEKVHGQLGFRVSLDNLAQATLGSAKSANGLLALRWWKEGKLDEIEKYCTQDVAITRDLYLHGRDKGFLLFSDKAGRVSKVGTIW